MATMERTTDDYSRTWGMYAHLSGLLTFTSVPLAGILGPLIIREQTKARSAFAAEQARHALNFHITTGIVYLVALVCALGSLFDYIFSQHGHATLSGFPTATVVFFAAWCVVYLWTFIMTIVGTVRSSNGTIYEYPLTIPFVRK